MKQKVDDIPLSELIPYHRNAREHSPEQVSQIARSIEEFGWTQPLLIDEKHRVITGHGRLLAAKQLDLDTVPCKVVTGWSEEKKNAYALADNRLALASDWDHEILHDEIVSLEDEDFSVDLLGFSDRELAGILDDDPGEEEEPEEKPRYGRLSVGMFKQKVLAPTMEAFVSDLEATYHGDMAAVEQEILCRLGMQSRGDLP